MREATLDNYIRIADHMADHYNKPFNVIKNSRGELLVFPASVKINESSEIVYSTGGKKS